jgi:hypothetical protein
MSARCMAFACAVLLGVVPASAATPDPDRLAEAKILVRAMKVEQMQNAMFDSYRAMVSRPVYPQRAIDIAIEEGRTMMRDIVTRPGGLVDLTTAFYAEEFSVEEMRQMRTFFESPAGVRYVDAQPRLGAKVSRQMGQLQREGMTKLCARVKERLAAERIPSASPVQGCPGPQ